MRTIDVRSGAIAPTLVKLSLPVLAGQACNLLYNLVDTYFIGLIDKTDPYLIGSTGLVFPIFFVFMAVSFGISGGVSSLVARAIGAGRSEDLDRTAESGLFMALIASTLFMGLFYPLGETLLRAFGGAGRLLEYGKEYLFWLLPVVPFMLLSAVFLGILQGEGRTIHMMISMIIGTVANIILDPLFIFGAKMGVAGAAFATALSNALGFIYLLVVFLATSSKVKIHWKVSKISLPVIGEVLRVGFPQSLGNLLASLSFVFYNRIMMDIDPYIISAFTIYSRIEQAALIPVWSLMSGLSAVAGQAAGAHDIPRMKTTVRTATLIGLSVSGTLLLAYAFASGPVFRLFQSDPKVLAFAESMTPWMAGATFLAVPFFMGNAGMAVAGFAGRSLALNAIRIYLLNVPACLLGAYVIGKGFMPSIIAIFISGVAALGLSLLAQWRFFDALEKGRIVIRQAVQGAPVPSEASAEA